MINEYCIDEYIGESDNFVIAKDVSSSYYGDYKSFVENGYKEVLGEVGLWRAVLLQAFIDLKSLSKKRRNQKIIKEAKDWFSNEEEVKTVCEMANYSYRSVKQLANQIIEQKRAKSCKL